jgi:hypothetical protein
MECQIDFARMGMLDSQAGRRRVVHALIFTAVYSRHMFVWLTFSQTLEAIIAGCEEAWRFFRVFKVLIPDNMKAIVVKADTINPQFNVGWLEYAQARGFVTDPARVCSPQDHAWSGWCDTCAATSLPARSSSIWPTRRTAPRFGAGIRPVSACTAPATPPGRGVRPVRSVAAVARARGALSGADLCAGLYRPRVIKRGTVNLSNPRAIFAGFASAVHQGRV